MKPNCTLILNPLSNRMECGVPYDPKTGKAILDITNTETTTTTSTPSPWDAPATNQDVAIAPVMLLILMLLIIVAMEGRK